MIRHKILLAILVLLCLSSLAVADKREGETDDEQKLRELREQRAVLISPYEQGDAPADEPIDATDGETPEETVEYETTSSAEETINDPALETLMELTRRYVEEEDPSSPSKALDEVIDALAAGVQIELDDREKRALKEYVLILRKHREKYSDWDEEEEPSVGKAESLAFETPPPFTVDTATYGGVGEDTTANLDDVNMTPDERQAKEWYIRSAKMLERARQSGQTIVVNEAYKLLDRAAAMGNRDAKILIAYAYLFGDHMAWSPEIALKLFDELADEGDPEGQMGLAFLYSTGIAVNGTDQAKAIVYMTFAGLGGSHLAHMALGYRYFSGVNVPSDCETALTWYRKAAQQVAKQVRNGRSPAVLRQRLPDELESVATGATTGQTIQSMDDNLLQYYKFLADKGDMSSQVGLGQLFLMGGRGVDQNFDQAFNYFKLAAEQGSANAHAYLGRMFLDGSTSTPQDNQTAFQYFKLAAEKNNPIGQSGLGVMYLYGKGVEQSYAKAHKLFMQANDQGWADGQLNLGHMYFNGLGVKRDYKQAIRYFQLASQGNHVLAFYNLAQIHAAGAGVARNCQTAVEFYKNVAERGTVGQKLMEAYNTHKEGSIDQSAFKYLFLAELGFEIAQTNFAYLLDTGVVKMFKKGEVAERALLHWMRSANQGYGLSRVKMGDYHYYGWGTPVDYEAAAAHYKTATEQMQNAQAMFNLGYMHEQGLGIKQDMHLAKRFYDMAADTAHEAIVPVNLALAKLAGLFLWHHVREWPLIDAVRTVAIRYLGTDWNDYAIVAVVGLLTVLLVARMRIR